MKRIVLATTIALAFISASGQEQQDSLKSVSMMQELQEVVVKGNLPNTRLKGNAMIWHDGDGGDTRGVGKGCTSYIYQWSTDARQ